MNVWVFCHYASVPSIGQYTGHHDLARGLVERGHQVTVFASSFSHYTFRETRLFSRETMREEVHEGVRFVWLRTPTYRANDWRRVRNMVAYAVRATLVAVMRRERPDVCLGVCVHPLAGLAAWATARVKGSAFVYELRDLWPLVLIDSGRISPNGPAAKLLYRLEHFLVRRAARVIGAWRYFEQYLEHRGYRARKVTWIPQFVDLARLPSRIPPAPCGPRFTVMYTGGHVYTHGLDVLLRAASILQARGVEAARFVFVGDGQEKRNLLQLACELELRNVEFRDPVPKAEVYRTMADANAFAISARPFPHHVYGVCMNKISDYLAMRRPIIYATRSSYNPVAEADCGITVSPEDAEGIAAAVIELMAKTPEEREAMGHRGYRHMLRYHERVEMVDRLEEVLKSACAELAAS